MTSGDKTTKYDQDTYMTNTIDAMRRGDILLFMYGYIKYDNGYNLMGFSESGYCFVYIPKNRRVIDTFEICKKPKYIYTR